MIQLRDYQEQGCSAVYAAARAGSRRSVLCSPVGSGKTAMMAELARRARKPLVLSPSLALLYQLKDNLTKWLGEDVDVEQGVNRASAHSLFQKRVVVASRQSMLSRGRYKGPAFDGTSLVIVDECHIGVTPPLMAMLSHFERAGAYVVGLSATPYKGKGKPLPYWDRPCFSYSLLQAIKDGWLVRPKGFLSQSVTIDLTMVDEVAHEWHAGQLAAVLTAEHAVQEITSLILQTFAGKPSAVYCHCVHQAKLVAEVLGRYGHKVSLVYSKQQMPERMANMEAFRTGETKIICNVGILSYGWDHPYLINVYNAAPTMSLGKYEQRIGRGTRALPDVLKIGMSQQERLDAIAASDKPHFNVYDITDTSRSMQLINALDVLDAASATSGDRRERGMAAMADGVDIIEEGERQDEIDRELMLLAAEELKEKRRSLVVGMTFDHEKRDLFSAGSDAPPKERGWRMLYGKYKGTLLRDVPDWQLARVVQTTKKSVPFKIACSAEINRRSSLRGVEVA